MEENYILITKSDYQQLIESALKLRYIEKSAICVVERGEWNGNTYPLLAIKAAIVDGEKIKADTWYKLENGEFVEVNENE